MIFYSNAEGFLEEDLSLLQQMIERQIDRQGRDRQALEV